MGAFEQDDDTGVPPRGAEALPPGCGGRARQWNDGRTAAVGGSGVARLRNLVTEENVF